MSVCKVLTKLILSSTVLLECLRNTPLNSLIRAIPDCKTADVDTLLQLVLRSEMSISRVSSQALVKLLSDSREITINELKNVNPNWKTLDGDHFLHALCQSNIEDETIIELMQYYNNIITLLENGWNGYLDHNGNTVLHIACQVDRFPLVSYLIDQAYCDPNKSNKVGNLPLDMTINQKVIDYLFQHDRVAVL